MQLLHLFSHPSRLNRCDVCICQHPNSDFKVALYVPLIHGVSVLCAIFMIQVSQTQRVDSLNNIGLIEIVECDYVIHFNTKFVRCSQFRQTSTGWW